MIVSSTTTVILGEYDLAISSAMSISEGGTVRTNFLAPPVIMLHIIVTIVDKVSAEVPASLSFGLKNIPSLYFAECSFTSDQSREYAIVVERELFRG